MGKLQELIGRYCPDGVEYTTLGEACFYPKTRVAVEDMGSGGYVSVENLAQNFAGRTGVVLEVTSGTAVIEYLAGDILVGNIRPYLKKVWLADADGGTNGDVLVFRVGDEYANKLLPEFLFTLMASDDFIDFDMRYAKGAKMPRGDKNAVLKYRIPVPPIEVQREIVRLLDAYTAAHDALVAKLNEEMELCEQQKASLERILLSGIDCEYIPVGDLAHTFVGLATSVTKWKRSEGTLLLHNSDIQPGRIVLKQTEYVFTEFAEKNKSKLLRTGDVITVHTGDVGTSAVVDEEFNNCIGFTTLTARVRDTDFISPEYLCVCLNSAYCKQQIRKMTISDRSNLNQKAYDKLLIPVPLRIQQDEIVKAFSDHSTLCADLMQSIVSEIEFRESQLTEFRNQLLSFPEKAA